MMIKSGDVFMGNNTGDIILIDEVIPRNDTVFYYYEGDFGSGRVERMIKYVNDSLWDEVSFKFILNVKEFL